MADRTKEIPIHIDRVMFKIPDAPINGAALRALPTPPIGDNLDLWEEVPGGEDLLIDNDTVVNPKPGMHFFTVPRQINPGLYC